MQYINKIPVAILAIIALFALTGCGGRAYKARPSGKQLANTGISRPDTAGARGLQQRKHKLDTLSAAKNNYTINQDKSLAIDVSKYGYTRFSIEDERITDVFIYPQEELQVRIHNQGYLIIVPKEQQQDVETGEAASQIYVTVTGEHGTTQDFSLRFTGKAPEPVKFVKSGLGKST